MRKRRFDRSTVIIKQSEDKISISTNNIVKQRSEVTNATASLTVSSMRCFFINELRPSLNVQRDSIRAKVFK